MQNKKYIFIILAIILIISAFFSTGYYHDDEHFQILEFAGLKLGINSAKDLAWEYAPKVRSAIQPFLVVGLHKVLNIFSIQNPFVITCILRIASALLTFIGIFLLFKNYSTEIRNIKLQKWFLLLSCFLWYNIFCGIRFSSENWSGNLFLIAFALLLQKPDLKKINFLCIGFLLGLSFVFRYQAGFLIFGLFAWLVFIKKEKFRHLLILITGILLSIFIGIIIDRWFYGQWTLTIWNYFEQNIIYNKTAEYGVFPWWYYISEAFVKAVPPISIFIIISIFLVSIFKFKHIITWTTLPFLLIHFLIGHKEIRFLFPLIGLIPIFIIVAIETIQERWNKDFLSLKTVHFFIVLSCIFNIMGLFIVMFRSANSDISMYKTIYEKNDKKYIYFTNVNPYAKERNVRYYKRQNLEFKMIDNIDNKLDAINKNSLIVTTNPAQLGNEIQKYQLIYTSYPAWMLQYNFNHWVDRTLVYYVYEKKVP